MGRFGADLGIFGCFGGGFGSALGSGWIWGRDLGVFVVALETVWGSDHLQPETRRIWGLRGRFRSLSTRSVAAPLPPPPPPAVPEVLGGRIRRGAPAAAQRSMIASAVLPRRGDMTSRPATCTQHFRLGPGPEGARRRDGAGEVRADGGEMGAVGGDGEMGVVGLEGEGRGCGAGGLGWGELWGRRFGMGGAVGPGVRVGQGLMWGGGLYGAGSCGAGGPCGAGVHMGQEAVGPGVCVGQEGGWERVCVGKGLLGWGSMWGRDRYGAGVPMGPGVRVGQGSLWGSPSPSAPIAGAQ